MMKKYLLTCISVSLLCASASADTVKIGILQDFTETAESDASAIALGGELAVKEAAESGIFLNGQAVVSIRGDSTCTDQQEAIAAAEQMIYTDGVNAIVGASCSDTTIAILQQVAVPNDILMISPSATSPALSTLEDAGLFFRTAPSDSRQGELMAAIVQQRGFESVAVTHLDNFYGNGLAQAFQSAYEAAGGIITAIVPLRFGQSDYNTEVNELSAAGGELLVIFSYPDQGGLEIIEKSLAHNSFVTFMFPDGMVGSTLTDHFGHSINGSFGTTPGNDSSDARAFVKLAKQAHVDATVTFVAETYDAAALILLAMQSAQSADSAIFKNHIEKVANAPGVKIMTGELKKALQILADGGEVDYVGAIGVELMGTGEPTGTYREMEIRNGQFETVAFH